VGSFIENACPLASTTLRSPLKRPIGAPFLACQSVTVTSSPGLKLFFAHPLLTISGGLSASMTQGCALASTFLTSTFKKQCGFAQSHSVTVPCIVTSFPLSYAAFPSCAYSAHAKCSQECKTYCDSRNLSKLHETSARWQRANHPR
jgi:hypothetical protein